MANKVKFIFLETPEKGTMAINIARVLDVIYLIEKNSAIFRFDNNDERKIKIADQEEWARIERLMRNASNE